MRVGGWGGDQRVTLVSEAVQAPRDSSVEPVSPGPGPAEAPEGVSRVQPGSAGSSRAPAGSLVPTQSLLGRQP